MIHAADGLRGGTEHLNSTIMQTSYGTLDDPKLYDRFLGLVSHEFFHTWNVKQLRPDGLLPYDYQKENYTKLLWVCEGTTSYYTDLVLARSGLKTETQYLESLSKLLNRYFENEGRKLQSLEESSFDSWIKFSRPNPHSPNTTVSFYSQGAIVSMILDLEIRKQTSNQASLDVVLRNLFEQFPLSGEGFSPTDFQSAVEKISGSSFSQFFQDYVSGVKQIDFDLWLNLVGLQLERKTETKEDSGKTNENLPEETESFKAFLGLSLNGNTVSSVKSDGPAFLAGLASGDEILGPLEKIYPGRSDADHFLSQKQAQGTKNPPGTKTEWQLESNKGIQSYRRSKEGLQVLDTATLAERKANPKIVAEVVFNLKCQGSLHCHLVKGDGSP